MRRRQVQGLRLIRDCEDLAGRKEVGSLEEEGEDGAVHRRPRVDADHVRQAVQRGGGVDAPDGRSHGNRGRGSRPVHRKERVPARRAAQREVRIRGLPCSIREPDREAVRVPRGHAVDRGGAIPDGVRKDGGCDRRFEARRHRGESRVPGPRGDVLREVVQVILVPARDPAALLVVLRGLAGEEHLGLQEGDGGVQLGHELRERPDEGGEGRRGDQAQRDGEGARHRVARDVRDRKLRSDLDRGQQGRRDDGGEERVVRPAGHGLVLLGAHEVVHVRLELVHDLEGHPACVVPDDVDVPPQEGPDLREGGGELRGRHVCPAVEDHALPPEAVVPQVEEVVARGVRRDPPRREADEARRVRHVHLAEVHDLVPDVRGHPLLDEEPLRRRPVAIPANDAGGAIKLYHDVHG